MKRLLAYLFLVLGLGLAVNIHSHAGNSAWEVITMNLDTDEKFKAKSFGLPNKARRNSMQACIYSLRTKPINLCQVIYTKGPPINGKKQESFYNINWLKKEYLEPYRASLAKEVNNSKELEKERKKIEDEKIKIEEEKKKIADAKKKAEPSQTQKVDQLHSHLIKPDTWVYFVRIANKEFVGLSKLDAGNFLNNAKNMSNYKFDTSDNLFKYQRNVGGRLRTDIRISKKLHDTLFYDNTSVLDGKDSGDGWGMGDFNLSKKKRDYLKSISTKIDDYKPYILKDLIDEYTEDNQLKNSLLAYFDKEKQIFTPKKKVKVAKV